MSNSNKDTINDTIDDPIDDPLPPIRADDDSDDDFGDDFANVSHSILNNWPNANINVFPNKNNKYKNPPRIQSPDLLDDDSNKYSNLVVLSSGYNEKFVSDFITKFVDKKNSES